MLENKYQRKPPLPFAPGMEVAGLVSALLFWLARKTVREEMVS